MNIRRYLAPDMRTAFKLVRDELGPDVVILSTRRVKGQIELTVAADQNAPTTPVTAAVRSVSIPTVGPRSETTLESIVTQRPTVASMPEIPVSSYTQRSVDVASVNVGVDNELRALRRLLETQLASLAWNDFSRRSPATAEIMRELNDLGFSREFIGSVLEQIPDGAELSMAKRLAQSVIESRIATTGDLWTERGGTIAIVGPSGSGKTTALAALAARWVMHHGTQGAALISAGESRFGVHENLARVGRLVGLPVYTLNSLDELPALLARLGDRRLVLVDTAGCGPRSAQFDEHLQSLRSTMPGAQFALALSASSHPAVIRETVAAYRSLGSLACVLTHIDECSALGGTISALIENQLPVAYTIGGPRLLDDLRPARADALVALCSQTADTDSGRVTREASHVA